MRIQLELNDKGTQMLDEIRFAIGENGEDRRMSHRELFDYAITFLHWGIKERQKNRIIASLDEKEKNYKELIMPIFTWVMPVSEVQSAMEVNVSGQEHEAAAAAATAGESYAASATSPAVVKAVAASVGKKS